MEYPQIRKHDRIQWEIVSACEKIGFKALQEYKGKDWRADVLVLDGEKRIAFEIQLSPQTLSRTLERQAKYVRDGIVGCWLFENPVSKLNEERQDLPLFYVEDQETGLVVNLGDRRKLDLSTFLENFILDNIQFKEVAKTKQKQLLNLVFYDMKCWKCGTKNYLYYVDTPFSSACNTKIKPEEALWESNSMEYRPEIMQLARQFEQSQEDIQLAQIKVRHSNTVGHSYMSFGCYKCDSIFGDWFVMEAKLDLMYETPEITFKGEIDLNETIVLENVPHWCFPKDGNFCDHGKDHQFTLDLF